MVSLDRLAWDGAWQDAGANLPAAGASSTRANVRNRSWDMQTAKIWRRSTSGPTSCCARCCASTRRIRPATRRRVSTIFATCWRRRASLHAAGARSGASQPARAAQGQRAPPLLLQGHVDVVTTAHQNWTHPPFAADVADGYIWGRGALDMKGGVAMMVAAFLRAHAEGASLPGDVVLCIVSDEEGWQRRRALPHRAASEQFAGVRYALGELGGFTLSLGGQRFYPIMVAEKQACVVVATVRGPGGHASSPARRGERPSSATCSPRSTRAACRSTSRRRRG